MEHVSTKMSTLGCAEGALRERSRRLRVEKGQRRVREDRAQGC